MAAINTTPISYVQLNEETHVDEKHAELDEKHVDQPVDEKKRDEQQPQARSPVMRVTEITGMEVLPGRKVGNDEVKTPVTLDDHRDLLKEEQEVKTALSIPIITSSVPAHNTSPTQPTQQVATTAPVRNASPPREHKEAVQKPSLTLEQLPTHLTSQIGFVSLAQKIREFKGVSLYELIKKHTSTKFRQGSVKYCYRLEYNTLNLSCAEARDNFGDAIVRTHADNYVKQHMHSISGEKTDLCYYTYSPKDLVEFLRANSGNKYTYLPVAVYAIDSANGTRHDMLLIFDNKNKLFYWFDCKNREDYLPLSASLPRNAIDVLFLNLASTIDLGYSYEPSESWQIEGTFQAYGNLGDLDFLVSSAWCYNMMLALESGEFDNPTAYLTVLDGLSKTDRFHLVYCSMLNMLGSTYSQHIPLKSQVDLTEERIKPVVSNVVPTITPQLAVQRPAQTQPAVQQPTIQQPVVQLPSNQQAVTRSIPVSPPQCQLVAQLPAKQVPINICANTDGAPPTELRSFSQVMLDVRAASSAFPQAARPNHALGFRTFDQNATTELSEVKSNQPTNTDGLRQRHLFGTNQTNNEFVGLKPMPIKTSAEVAGVKRGDRDACSIM